MLACATGLVEQKDTLQFVRHQMFSVHLHHDHPDTLERHSDDGVEQCSLMARANEEVTVEDSTSFVAF